MIKIKQQDKIAVLGTSGCGKTTLMNYIVDNVIDRFPNVVVIDLVGNFSKNREIRKVGKVPCKNPRPSKACLRILNEDQLDETMKTLIDVPEPLFIVLDEVDVFVKPQKMLPEMYLYTQVGRNWDKGGMFAVRQVGRLNKNILSNSHYLILFKLYNKSDIDYLDTILSVGIGRRGLGTKDLLSVLDDYEFWLIDLHHSKPLGVYRLDEKTNRLVGIPKTI